ncbi:uroporphyrinogen-III C-methyltransferase, partial [Ideonella sp.]|uniref:uroporphyrinogen-III C-methyltransferase n=1 Tax=Ideonella sp. TaxID=1929293 RepID=UPI003BB771A8
APGRRAASPVAAQPAAKPAAAASAAASGAVAASDWQAQALQTWRELASQVWTEVRTLVRVTEIERPEAMLITPEQGFFLRENLKLRLLNARLALMSRQFDLAQTDLRMADQALDRYFDRNSRRVVAAADLVRTVMGQSRAVTLPGPDNTLAALAAAAAGR